MKKLSIAVLVLTAMMSTFAVAKEQKTTKLDKGYSYVNENISVKVSPYSLKNLKEVTIKFEKGNNAVYSSEYVDCKSPRHKTIMMDLYENGKYSGTQYNDVPVWEENDDIDKEINKIACSQY